MRNGCKVDSTFNVESQFTNNQYTTQQITTSPSPHFTI